MMIKRVAFVASEVDLAANLMAEELIKVVGSEEFSIGDAKAWISRPEQEVLYAESEGELGADGADLIVILSRHSGVPGRPIITTHVSGNFGDAPFGGDPHTLSVACPPFMKVFLQESERRAQEIGFDVGFEPTHHGPTLDTPLAFVEVGCSAEEWSNRNAAKVVVDSSLAALRRLISQGFAGFTYAVGFGGPHINGYFTKIQLRSQEFAIGHVLRRHDSESASEEAVRLAFKRNFGTTEVAIVDWKGLRGKERSRILGVLEEMGVRVMRARNIAHSL